MRIENACRHVPIVDWIIPRKNTVVDKDRQASPTATR